MPTTNYVVGLTATEMIADVAGVVNLTATDATVITEMLRYLNRAQALMYFHGDWPELIVADATFTTDAAISYDLTNAEAGNHGVGAQFGRIRGKTIRVSDDTIPLLSKDQWDRYDPDRSESGDPEFACLLSRTDFRILPYGSTGDVVYFDYVKLPVRIESATAAAIISFYPDRHELIVEGAQYLAMKKYNKSDRQEWILQKRMFEKDMKDMYNKCNPYKSNMSNIIPIKF